MFSGTGSKLATRLMPGRSCFLDVLAQRQDAERVHTVLWYGVPQCRRHLSWDAQCREVTANLTDKRRTNDQGPDRHGQRSGPWPATSV